MNIYYYYCLRAVDIIGICYSISPVPKSEKIKAKYIKEGLKYKDLEDRLN